MTQVAGGCGCQVRQGRFRDRLDLRQEPSVTQELAPMAMPQRDNEIEEIKRLDVLLEYAVELGNEAETARRFVV